MVQPIHRSKLRRKALLRFFAVLAPLTLVGIAAFYYAFYLLNRVDTVKLEGQTSAAIEVARNNALDNLATAYKGMLFISNSYPVRQFLYRGDLPWNRNQVEEIFLNIANTHKLYEQIQLLSNQGRELVRIDYRSGRAQPIPIDEMQDQSDKFYFTKAARILDARIYMSPMGVDIEQSRQNFPHKPVIRLAKPLRDELGDLLGVVVLNFRGDILLEQFRETMHHLPGKSLLANNLGQWLVSGAFADEPESNKQPVQPLSVTQPELWHRIEHEESGLLQTPHGRVIFATINPLITPELINDMDLWGLNTWKIINIMEPGPLSWESVLEHLTTIYPVLIAYPVGWVLLWYWAYASAGRKIAEGELRTLNVSLEEQVNLRTHELEATKDATILSLASLAGTRDDETGEHIRRTQQYVRLLCETLRHHPDFSDQLDDRAINLITKSAPLHDIGKVGIPDAILRKPERLTANEFEVMKHHTIYGKAAIEEGMSSLSANMTIKDTFTFLHYARDIAHYHHERWDGRGYPEGLSEEDIPLAARLMALADVYDALVTKRVYKPAFSRKRTETIIMQESEGQFDPRIVEAFTQVKEQFWEVRERYSG